MITPGALLGPYLVVRKLGVGGMGDVYLATDTRRDRKVALKLLPAVVAQDPHRLFLFRREALALASLNHPNIARIHGIEQPSLGMMILVLEFIDGESLAQRLEGGALPLAEVYQIGLGIASALAASHRRGVVHRDLKPANVMLEHDGVAKVLDFGIALTSGIAKDDAPEPEGGSAPAADGATMVVQPGATVVVSAPPSQPEDGATVVGPERSDTGEGEIAGTPGYMAPEQIRAERQDARADLFAFGALLFECASGSRAFPGRDHHETFQRTLERDPDWRQLPADLHPAVLTQLQLCLQKEAGARPTTFASVIRALREALGLPPLEPVSSHHAIPGNLPQAQTAFVGRERELRALEQHLDQSRVVTLTGIGGTGKSRLAVELGQHVAQGYPDGTWHLDLTAVEDTERILFVLSGILEVEEVPGQTIIEALFGALRGRRLLLILDNCDHHVPRVGTVLRQLLAAGPQVNVVATCRRPLGYGEEMVFAVPPLGLPVSLDAGQEMIAASEAVRLFADRAARSRPGFVLDGSAALQVAQICERLDGIPMAIELAAAQLKRVTLAELLHGLSDRFAVLDSDQEGSPLRATLDWSYETLVEEEQALLHALAAFAGGWSLEAAAAVVGEAETFAVLENLDSLEEHSLVVVEQQALQPRYRALETVREYAREKLEAGQDASACYSRHLAYFRELAETAQKELIGPGQKDWFLRLDLEHANILVGLHRSRTLPGGAEQGLRLAVAMARYWATRGLYELARKELEHALAQPGADQGSSAHADGLLRLGGMALYQGDYEAARVPISRSLEIQRARGDVRGIARSLSGLFTIAIYQQDYAHAEAYGLEVLELYRAQENTHGEAVSLHNLGFLAFCQGQAQEAVKHFEEALRLLQHTGDQKHISLTLAALGHASVRVGHTDAAAAQLIGCLSIVQNLGAKREAADALFASADLAVALGDYQRGARLVGFAKTLRQTINASLSPAEKQEEHLLLERLSAEVEEKLLLQIVDGGRVVGFEASVAETLEWLSSLPIRLG